MKVELTPEVIKAIESIVNYGNKAVIQRKGDGVIVMEERRTIRYKD